MTWEEGGHDDAVHQEAGWLYSSPILLREFYAVDEAGKSLMTAALQQLGMSARSFHRVLKLARTIADLAGRRKFNRPI